MMSTRKMAMTVTGSLAACVIVVAGSLGAPVRGGTDGSVGDAHAGYDARVNSGEDTASVPGSGAARGLFADDSPWNTPIPKAPLIDPASDALIERFAHEYATTSAGAFWISVDEWSVTVFWADDSTPRYDVPLSAAGTWAPVEAATFLQVPIPDDAVPDPSDDGHMVIVSEPTGFMYEFWQARKVDGTWEASWGNRTPIGGSGFYPGGLSCRGAGVALLAGMIWPEELETGEIRHALAFSHTFNRAGGPVAPATESDGDHDDSLALPEGARLQLDPNLDLDTLDLEPWQKAIAQAMQRYGMINIDNSGSVELEVINPLSFASDPYPAGAFDAGFSSLPVTRFRVIEMGPQDGDYDVAQYLDDPSSHGP